jgi:hypothetical protein
MNSFNMRTRAFVISLCLGVLLSQAIAGAAEPKSTTSVVLSSKGQALLPVVVGEKATERVRQSAAVLAEYLQRISGAKFEVTTGGGEAGIAVGLPADFSGLPVKAAWDAADPTQQEDYLLHSHVRGLYVIGASELAVEHAVWDLLYRLGYRQFFPGEHWEVIPNVAELSIAIDARQHPDFFARRIWYGYGPWDYAAEPYARWCARNRATSGIVLNSGHSYDGIISRNKAAFTAHPEYLGLVGGQRKSSKFCISNPALRKLVIDDALASFEKNPAQHSISLDPSDGPGWCECEQCAAMGNVSDRALTLANEVAEAVNAKHRGKYVGMYAYSQHSPPPTIRVHPQVVISVATAFIQGGYSVDQLLDGWQRQGATLGIREYYSVHTWDRDLPGKSRGSNVEYLKTTIPHFHGKGARFLSAESSDNWGPNGLGYYLAARMTWDVGEAQQIDELVADFLEKSFGPAKEPMAEYYRLIDGSNRSLLSDDLIGRMYRLLGEARKLTDDAAIGRRLDDLILYTRYVELWMDYSTASGPERQAAFEKFVRHAYRMRGTMMVHSKAVYRDVAARDKSVSIPEDATWGVPEGRNPWKSSEPFSRGELDAIVAAGIDHRKLLDFTPVSFSQQLVPATALQLPDVPTGSMGLYSRGVRSYFTWLNDPPANITLTVKGGVIYQSRGDVQIDLYPAAETQGKSVCHVTVAPDKQEHTVVLQDALPGLNRIDVSDKAAGTSVSWPDGTPMTIQSGTDSPAELHGRWTLYFYVPKETKTVGGFSSGLGTLLDGSGRLVHTFDNKPGYFSVPVAAGQDGKLWKFQNSAGQRLLMTVPPCLARSAAELLLPAEVIESDKR